MMEVKMMKIKRIMGITILLMVTAACGLTDTISSGAEQVATLANEAESLATSAAEAVPQAALDDPRAFLLEAMRNQMLSTPFHATMQSVSTDSIIDYTIDYQPPDRFHMIMPGVVEGIVIGTTMYLNVGGSWTQVPLSDDFASAFGMLGPGAEDVYDTISDVAFAGVELLDGRATLIFTYQANATIAGVTSTSTNKLWLGATDLRVYKFVSEGESGGQKSTTTGTYEYDPGIKVDVPM
jgi:outer membrane lipoprotein-sorting protein